MTDRRIFVEVNEGEAEALAAMLRIAVANVQATLPGDPSIVRPAISTHRLADRFDLAATNSDEPVPFIGRAVFIAREMG